MKPWEGPGKAFSFVRELTLESFQDAVKLGLTKDLLIPVHAEADNALIMTSNIMQIAARSDCLKSIKLMRGQGFDLNQVDILFFIFNDIFFYFF
mgnify:CR=1 FL=1